MPELKSMAILGLFLLCSTSVNAVIIGVKDWLQITHTYQSNWHDYDEIFDTKTGECNVNKCILNRNQTGDTTQPLVDLTGYIWASNTEVNELFMSYTQGSGLNNLNNDDSIKLEDGGLFSFFDDFAATKTDTEGGETMRWIDGWTRNYYSAGDLGIYGDVISGEQFYPKYGGAASASLTLDAQRSTVCSTWDCRIQMPGAWLYKTTVTVPESSTTTLLGLGLISLAWFRRKRLSIS